MVNQSVTLCIRSEKLLGDPEQGRFKGRREVGKLSTEGNLDAKRVCAVHGKSFDVGNRTLRRDGRLLVAIPERADHGTHLGERESGFTVDDFECFGRTGER